MTSAREINASIRYTMWSVFAARDPLGDGDRDAIAREADELLGRLAEAGTVVRGCYDVSGLRADADLMVWWHASTAEALQEAYQQLRRTRLGEHLAPVW
jgi:hydrogen peroxide-dependent heme synthase